LTYWWGTGLVVLGVVLVSVAVLTRIQSIKLVVVGVPGGETLSGHRSGLDALFRIVREKKSIEE
jgi:hypothetical protein